MRETFRKTWSQEVVAVQRRMARAKETGFFTYEKQAMLLLAVKTAMAAGICYWLARLVGLQDGYWGSISAIIVLQSNVGSTVNASRDRLIGTLIGAAFGAVFSLLGEGLWVYLLAVVTAMVACSLLGLKNSSRLAAVTVTILMLVHRTGSNWTLPLHRVIEVLLGILVALVISTLVLPSRARLRLRDGLAQEFLLLGALFDSVMAGFHWTATDELPRLWGDEEAAAEANRQLLAAARNEPSGGPASLEGLSLLHQFATELADGLRALELAGRPHEGEGEELGYAGHLEPELGRLTADIQREFQYVAECTHRWKFDTALKGLSLDEDIAALEAKIAALRPGVLEYPQAEIFRVYAVQLHLKQIARLLRAARVETNEAVG